MSHEIHYRDALPEMPEAFYQTMQDAIAELEAPMKRRYKVTTTLAAALLALLILAGAAFATIHSHLLNRLFPEGATPTAEEMLIQDALSDEAEGLKLTVAEHLYDGRNLHLNWTVESERDDTIYYLTNYWLQYADGTPLLISHWNSRLTYFDVGGSNLTALNLTMDDVTTAKWFEGMGSFGFLEDEVPDAPWMFMLDVCAYTTDLSPVAVSSEIYDIIDVPDDQIAAMSANRQIPIITEHYGNLTRQPEYLDVFVDYGGRSFDPHAVESTVKAHNECGLLTPLARLSVSVPINPNDSQNQQIRKLTEPKRLNFGELTIDMQQLEFDTAGIRTKYVVPIELNRMNLSC